MARHRPVPAMSSAVAAIAAASLIVTAGSSVHVVAQTGEGDPLARLEQIIVGGTRRDKASTAEVKVIRGQAVVPASPSLSLFAGDEVITGVNVSLTVIMLDAAAEQGNSVIVGPASQFSIRGKRSVFLTLGKLLADVRGLFDVLTSRQTLGAKGTEFEVRVTEDEMRLLVLDGTVETRPPDAPAVFRLEPSMPQRVGPLLAMFRPDIAGILQQPRPAAGQRWLVEVSGRGPARTRQALTIANRCQQPHLYDVEGPETLSWFHLFSSDRIQVEPGQRRSVEIEIQVDASNVAEGTYTGDGVVKCLDCFNEPACTQIREPWPIQVTVGATSGSTVRALQEMRITGAGAAAPPVDATEDRVRSAVNWTTDVIVAGQPSYSARRMIPHFESVQARTAAFRQARFAAFWQRDTDSYEILGNTYSDWGEGPKALEAYTKVADAPARRNDPEFLTSMAEAHRLKGHLDQAEALTRRALAASRDAGTTLNTIGNIYLDRAEIDNDASRSQEFLERASGAYQRATQASLRSGTTGQAVARANIGDVHVALGRLSQEIGRYDVAVKEYESADESFRTANSMDSRYAFSRVGWGDAFRGLGEVAAHRNPSDARNAFNRAEAQYRTGLKDHPDLPDAHVGLGDVFADQGRRQEALESYARAITVRPSEPSGYYRAGVLLAQDNPVLASRYLHTYVQLQPDTFKNRKTVTSAARIMGGLRAGTVSVPSLANLQDQAARDLLSRNNLKAGSVTSRPAAGVRQGIVVDQQPAAGTVVAAGAAVDFVVASGEGPGVPPGGDMLVVPDVVNRPLADAVSLLERAGLKAGRIERKKSDRAPETVLKQTPGARNRVRPGTEIALEIAERESRMVKVPDVVGDDRAHAIRKIQEKELGVGDIRVQASCEEGKVISQAPPKDARVPAGTAVSFTIAGPGEAPASVPRLLGLSQARAEDAIRESRLKVRRVNRRETEEQAPGTVLDQKPDPFTSTAPGCPVDMVVAAPVPLVEVPNFVGMNEADARRRLPGGLGGILAELRLGRVTYREESSEVTVYRRRGTTAPTVVEQNPAASSRVRRGTAVDLVVLRPRPNVPPATVAVPNVVGMDQKPAEAAIRNVGLSVGPVSYVSTNTRAGQVIRQSPAAGQQVQPGTQVTLFVSMPYIK